MTTTTYKASIMDNRSPFNVIPGEDDIFEEENEINIEDEDDLHEIMVDDDLGEPDPEGDYWTEPDIDDDLEETA